jgi:hypothetical protein
MHRKTFVGTTFFFILALIVIVESLRLGIGSLRSPEAGLFPFFAGAALCLLSIISFLSDIKSKYALQEQKTSAEESYINLKVVSVLVSLIVYGLMIDVLGFLLCTGLIIIFWLKAIVPQRIFVAITSAIFIPLVSYLVFHVWLKVPLPKGVLGF